MFFFFSLSLSLSLWFVLLFASLIFPRFILSTVMFLQAPENSFPRTDGLYLPPFLLVSELLSFVQTTKPKPT